MPYKKIYNGDFWLTLFAGGMMVLLVFTLGVSFFRAILNTQLESRKDYLIKQTELAAQSLETDINRFEEDAQFFLNYLEEEDLESEDFGQEFTTVVRRVFNNYPGLIDSVWVDMKGSRVSFTMTPRGNFIRKPFEGDFEQKKQKPHVFFLQGDEDVQVVFSLDLMKFSKNFASNYYLNPSGGKFLVLKNQFFDIKSSNDQEGITISELDFETILRDVSDGVMGVYEVSWKKNQKNVGGILVQYPFDLGKIEDDVALIFFVESEDLSSGVYSTFFMLFVGLVVLLIGTVVIFIRSINNNLQSQRILRSKNREISHLFDQQSLLLRELRGFVFFHDSKGSLTRLSDEAEDILGYPKYDIFEAFQKGSDNENVKKLRSKIIDSVERKLAWIDFEFDYTRPDGQQLRFRFFEKLIFDRNGNFRGGTGICTDVSKQYKDRLELEKSENKLRSVITNIPDIITIYDNQGKILDLHVKDENNIFEISGTVLGKNVADLIPENQKDDVIKAFDRAKVTGMLQATELMLKTSGVAKYFEIRFFPLDKSQIMSLAKEITSQKIWENGLVDAMNAADNASRAKSEFLANMSHEIRTPMNGLLGMIDLLEKTPLNKEQKLYLEIIKNSGNSLLSIIKDILDYSKIEAGKIELNEEVFSPGKELEKLIQIFFGLGQKKDLKISTHHGKDTYDLVQGDKEKINQVILNLVGNAVKFTPEGGKVSVFLDIEELQGDLIFLNCRVVDSGIGIPKDFIDHLTDPFFQVESSNTRSYQGTGLGLAIAKKIIELMGGELKIESEAGVGSEFSFSVLVRKMNESSTKTISLEPVERNDWTGMAEEFPLRILIAEDNDFNLQLMKLMLDQLGYDLEVARNGKEAVEKVQEQEFDLILMDVQMPVMNGLEATKEIRKDFTHSKLKIIGLSANVFDEDRKRAIDSGMDDYLTKPLRMGALAKKLEEFAIKINQ
jgi:PAS domain S-box-containing protein